VEGDSVSMRLPGAEITDVELNPSSFETFYENGRWSGAEVAGVKAQGRKILIEEANRRNLTKKADEKAREAIKDLLVATGFKRIHVVSN
ncbi:MAG: DUF4230 domain-containing protein, partial [Chitinophagaceae bacterium]